MKKAIAIFLAVFFLLFSGHANAEPTDYKKFGRIATAVIKEDYPGQPVKDYQYQGRRKMTENKVADSFEFTVQENNKDKKVTVIVVHNLDNEKTLNITVQE
ncbi:DUF3889 domain-containing protein [Bacillus sp. KH172YL63]|uniref:DUF3889 domain-containing protein n=1 Tax=Bacillus sp. KH172YL63 TaxID=2709784 RepID=UPI0013E4428E|nr:DUF3889 domain-containing protein [Bacillus sp. KH172YL63]BCB02850.1 hypothetical protein KH172YL63_09830 [Bacillus sp. KH172YL63]